MRRILALLVSLVFLVAACSSTTEVQNQATNPANEMPQHNMEGQQMTGELKTFKMTAKKWEFSPSVITVSQDDHIRLEITSIDVNHGFSIEDFGIDAKLQPGKTEVVEFIADKKGTFEFYCSVYCGEGHKEMEGTLIVN
ncbi:MAG: cupredoxin domain-containing protein [Nanoarchaeota archaeon]